MNTPKHSGEQLEKTLFDLRHLVLTAALFNGWVFTMSWSGIFRAPFDLSLAGFEMNGLWMTSLFVCTLVLAIFFIVPRLCTRMRTGILTTGIICMFVSILLIVSAILGFGPSTLLYLIGGVSSGIGTGILTVYIGALIAPHDAKTVLRVIAVSLFGAAIICLLASLLPELAVWIFMVFAPFLCFWAFQRAYSLSRTPNERSEQSTRSSSADQQGQGNTKFASRTALFLILVVILGLSGGLLRGLIGADILSEQNSWLFGAACMVGAIMLFFSKAPERGESLALFYRAIVLVAIAFILLSTLALYTIFAFAVHTIGFIYFYGLLWVFCSIYSRNSPLPMRVFAGGLMANQIGQFVGALFGNSLFGLVELDSIVTYASNLMIYLLLFLVIILLAKLSSKSSDTSERSTSETSIKESCVAASNAYQLTNRESEILFLLVKGLNRGDIAQQLFISPETVKTHIRHIYEKLEVSTRVELLNKVTGVRKD